MTNRLKRLLLVIAIYVIASTCSPADAKAMHPVNVGRLQQAGDLINSKQYLHGYVSFKSMAKHGCPYSQCILGIMHQNGIGTRKNGAQAKYWFQKSARQGFADAENHLGQMYYRGDGIKKNLTLAKQWLTRAANHGIEEARELLAQIPGEKEVSNELAQAPQQAAWTAGNIKQSWEGYSEVTKQLTQLSSLTQSN